jgi:hypothetical protein
MNWLVCPELVIEIDAVSFVVVLVGAPDVMSIQIWEVI